MPEAKSVEVPVKQTVMIEEIEGGLYLVSYTINGVTVRKAATSYPALVKLLAELFHVEKKARKPRTPKAGEAPKAAPKK